MRATGRTTMGVTGIHLQGNDYLIGMSVVEPEGYLLVLTEKGYGKRTQVREDIAKTRGTLAGTTISQTAVEQIGQLAQARVVQDGEEITLISSGGIVLRIKVSDISVQGRATQGVKVMDLGEGDSLAAVARIPALEVRTAAEAKAAEAEDAEPETRAENQEENSAE